MIKKLERHIRKEDGVKISCPPDNVHIISKINELVDAVNSLRDDCNLLMGYIAPEDKCEPVKPDEDIIYKGE